MVHAPTEVNGCNKYEYNPFNIGGCRAVTMTSPKHQSVGVFIKFQSTTSSQKINIETPQSIRFMLLLGLKYEQNLSNIVGGRSVTKVGDGQLDGQMDEQTVQGTPIPFGLNGPGVKTDGAYSFWKKSW